MFGTIRRHQKWLVPATFITVLCFIAFFSPTNQSGCSGRGPSGLALGSIDGRPISLPEFRRAQAEVFLLYFLSHGDWPDKDASAKQSGFDVERETYIRLFVISKIEEFGIQVSPQAVGLQAAEILRGMGGRSGQSPTLEQFSQQVLQPRGFSVADFQRFLQHQLALRELISLVGMCGRFIGAEEATALLQLEQQQMATEAIFFSPTNYLASVTVSPAEVEQFYTNSMARYRLPERRQVGYVKFDAKDFQAEAEKELAGITNLNQQIDQLYLERGTNYYSDATTPEAAKARILEEVRHNYALRAARSQAVRFTDELISLSPVTATNLDALAARQGLTAYLSSPFDQRGGPVELEAPPGFTAAAFKLTADEPFAGPVMAEKAVYVVALRKVLPSEIPSLETIRTKVQEDWRYLQAAQLAYAAGTNFVQSLATGLAQGKSYAALCADARVAPVKLPVFSLTTRALPELEDRVSLGRLQEVAFSLPVGQVSGLVPTEDGGGMLLRVLARTPANSDKIKTDSPAFLAQVRQTRQAEAFNVWFSREAERALRDTPIARAQRAAPAK